MIDLPRTRSECTVAIAVMQRARVRKPERERVIDGLVRLREFMRREESGK